MFGRKRLEDKIEDLEEKGYKLSMLMAYQFRDTLEMITALKEQLEGHADQIKFLLKDEL